MLIVMTFNVWLLVSTVVGAGVGYLCGEGVLNRSDYRNQSREEVSYSILCIFGYLS